MNEEAMPGRAKEMLVIIHSAKSKKYAKSKK